MMYSGLAKYYDKLGFNEFTTAFLIKILPLFEKYMRTHNVPQPDLKIIDLACGTGELCMLLYKNGFKSCGLDISREMLDIARQKNPKLKFYNKDIRAFSLKPKFRIATCSFDSLNHIMEENELLAAFKNVYRCLYKNGLFIFDMNTIIGLRNWSIQLVNSRKEHLIIRNGGYDYETHTAYMFIEAFVKSKGKYYDRIYDVFHQKGYSNSTISRLLKKAGFLKITMSSFHREKPVTQCGRIFVVAHK
jgi:SAM-dependent methyltransferase